MYLSHCEYKTFPDEGEVFFHVVGGPKTEIWGSVNSKMLLETIVRHAGTPLLDLYTKHVYTL